MAPHVERRRLARQTHGILEGVAVSHQCCCRQNAVEVRFDDPFVHVVREAEIVGIDNRGASESDTSLMVRNFFGLARISLSEPRHLARRAVQRVVELRIHHELPDRPLAGIDLVHRRIDFRRDLIELRIDFVVVEQLARRPLPLRSSRAALFASVILARASS